MIKVFEGNDFLIQEAIKEILDKKFKGFSEAQLRYAIVRNPSSIASVTSISGLGSSERIILWQFDVFKKLERFNPYVIPKGTDIIVWGAKIDKRLKVYKDLEPFSPDVKLFKDLYPNQVENWIIQQKTKLKVNIAPDAIKLLALYYGTNLKELSNKLEFLAKLKVLVTRDLVLEHCSSINEFSIFELQDCVTARNLSRSIYIYRHMAKGDSEPIGVIRYFVSFFEKLITVKTGDELLIAELKLHAFVLKKLNDIPRSIKEACRNLDSLRIAELDIFAGIPTEHVMDILFLELVRTK